MAGFQIDFTSTPYGRHKQKNPMRTETNITTSRPNARANIDQHKAKAR